MRTLGSLVVVSLVLLPLVAGLASPAASARHVCQPYEPPWTCHHLRPTPETIVAYVCDLLHDPVRECADPALP